MKSCTKSTYCQVLGTKVLHMMIPNIFEAFPKSHFLSGSLGGVELSDQPSFSVTCSQGQMEEENPAPLPPSPESWEKILRRLDQLSRTNLILLDIGIQLH